MIYQPKTHTFSGVAQPGFFTIALQFTRYCNYKCVHCSEVAFLPSIATDKMYKIIDKLADHKVQRINISGGEPTLRPDWLTILEYLAKKNISVSLATNCSQLDTTTLRRLTKLVANIRISLYGNEQIHDDITEIKGSFQKTCEAAKEAKSMGIPVYACVAVMKRNLNQLSNIQTICRELGIEKLLAYSLVPKGRGLNIYESDGVTRQEVAELLKTTQEIPEIYWSPFDEDGICALIQSDGSLVATPYFGETQVKYVGDAVHEEIKDLWDKYPFKEHYTSFSTEKLKCK